uniref:Uncharacterized protein n=1 Tax=Nothoprocta perdicaria TaxID=30464 RepID=A0A8C6ZWP2_NOTPE
IITTAVILFVSILMSGVSLMCMNRSRQESSYEVLNPYSPRSPGEEAEAEGSEGPRAGPANQLSSSNINALTSLLMELEMNRAYLIRSLMKNSACFSADQCVSQCSAQTCILAQEEQLLQTGDKQLARHVLLCLLLVVGMFAFLLLKPRAKTLSVCRQQCTGKIVYKQVPFGDLPHVCVVFLLFLRLEFLWGGREASGHTDPALPEEIRLTCQQFVRYHRDHCVKSIVRGRR